MSETKKESVPKKSWLKGFKAEFKRITWASKDTVMKETTAVVVLSVILGLIIAIIDMAMRFGLNAILGI
jgi:preprotein translocase, SecE subunit, bacterial